MSVLKLTKNDITSSGNNNGEKLKLKKSDLMFDAATYSGWEAKNKSYIDTLDSYYTRMSNNEWMSEDDFASYRKTLDSYIENSNRLRGVNRIFGSGYTEEEEKKWQDAIASLNKDAIGSEDFAEFAQKGADTAAKFNKWGQLEGENKIAAFRNEATANTAYLQAMRSGGGADPYITLAQAMTEEEANVYNRVEFVNQNSEVLQFVLYGNVPEVLFYQIPYSLI